MSPDLHAAHPDAALPQVAARFRLSSGEDLLSASREKPLVLVFLRHFGCTFTRQILRGLEALQEDAERHGARLVLVHMLRGGGELRYLGETKVGRLADPRRELYRAFGLGKGTLVELFGPRVWWLGALSVIKGCGIGHLAGDGFQMPGVFVFSEGKIVAAQPARSAADLPDLPRLFQGLPSPERRETVGA